MVEDYLNGEIDELPEFLRFFNNTLIEWVRQFNSDDNLSGNINTGKYGYL